MTAEERAKEFSWRTCPGGEGHDPGEGDMAYTCWRCNADVIRDAEDETLERAALLVDVEHDAIQSPARRATVRALADRIRSLKSRGPGVSGKDGR